MGRWFVVSVALLLGAPAFVRAGSPFETRLEVTPQGISIHGQVYRKMIPMSDLQRSHARIVDLDREPGLLPWFRIYGVGLPAYRSGLYRLKDREKAILALTSHQAVYIPTTRGYAILVSPAQSAEFLAAVQNPPAAGQVFSVTSAHRP